VTVPSPLYVILDLEAARGRPLRDLLEAVLAGGGRWVQLRDKTLSMADLWPLARDLRARCREAGATFIVNDRADLALALDADGLHLGQGDLPAAAARRVLRPGMILGVSTHDEAQADRACGDGADYVAVGSMFPTGTKAGFQLVGPDLLRRIRPRTSSPLVAIGGITRDNAMEVMEAGADAVAVISAICASDDPEGATRSLLGLLRSGCRAPGTLTAPGKSL
jgi:thiamine-phosphate diphosphorylase